eukprot:8971830-Pyramimonas_sp.AAC.1
MAIPWARGMGKLCDTKPIETLGPMSLEAASQPKLQRKRCPNQVGSPGSRRRLVVEQVSDRALGERHL